MKHVAVDLGEPQSVEELWEEYFADPTQWWDNRADKRNPRSPDFRHKVTRKALWIHGWSTPSWVKAMLKLAGDGKMQPRVDYGTKDSQDTTQGDRLSKGLNGKRSIVLLLQESTGILDRVVAVVCPCKVQEPRLKQLGILRID